MFVLDAILNENATISCILCLSCVYNERYDKKYRNNLQT